MSNATNPTRFNSRRCRCGVVTSVLAVNGLRAMGAVIRGRNEGWCQAYDASDGRTLPWNNGTLYAPCRSCGKQVGLTAVHGKFRADKGCDARCMNAKGHSCECSCGGRNHGAGHEGPSLTDARAES